MCHCVLEICRRSLLVLCFADEVSGMSLSLIKIVIFHIDRLISSSSLTLQQMSL
ncbi:hypothetical protein B6H53_004512 [Salmonella enterica subsp. enterica serovar Typhimurium]|nr:hypothetical protein [Salmonella enterica subsp. enterica serovar Typhimurium]